MAIEIKQREDFKWVVTCELGNSILRDPTGQDFLWLAQTQLLEAQSPLTLLAIYARLVEEESFLVTDLELAHYNVFLQKFHQEVLDGRILDPDTFMELVYMIQGQKFESDIMSWFNLPITLIMTMRAVVQKYPRQTL